MVINYANKTIIKKCKNNVTDIIMFFKTIFMNIIHCLPQRNFQINLFLNLSFHCFISSWGLDSLEAC
jgi:hypothetical protein